jgi:hypothetical protein
MKAAKAAPVGGRSFIFKQADHVAYWQVCPTMSVHRVAGSDRSSQNDAFDRAPRGRELPVREGLTRIIVDWSGSWQAARPGNWLGRSPATKAALGC